MSKSKVWLPISGLAVVLVSLFGVVGARAAGSVYGGVAYQKAY